MWSEIKQSGKNLLQEVRAFNVAMNTNTISAYNLFIDNYPESRFVHTIKEQVEFLEFQRAHNSYSVSILQYYLTKYPQGKYVSDVKQEISNIIKSKIKVISLEESHSKEGVTLSDLF